MKDSYLKRKLIVVYEYFYEKRRIFELHTRYRLPIMGTKRTINYIRKHRCSIARYGDGEFRLMMKVENLNLSFQSKSLQLSEMLLDVLKRDNSNLLLCFPRYFNSTRGLKEEAKHFWIEWGRRNQNQIKIVELIRENAKNQKKFGDALISRPYMDMSSPSLAKRIFPQLKKLWEQQDILILEGEQTRLGIGNDLFANARTVKRILAPAINAFDSYEELKKAVIDNYKGELLLIALGPTATVLAADFSERDIWALDIGHVDIEYEWYLNGAKTKTAIKGKYTNEVADGRIVGVCEDREYLSQIIARVNSH